VLGSGLFNNRIGEDLQVAESTGDFVRLRHNRVGLGGSGNLEVIRNLSTAKLFRNHVEDKLQCSDNDPAPKGANNDAGDGKEGQCAAL
jgi:hypothetical protein